MSINENMILEDVLQAISKNPVTNLTVKNDKGNIVGSISIKELLNGIKRPVSKSKKSYT